MRVLVRRLCQEQAQITPVILCGGSGTRLWPLSRKSYPKQFSALMGENSLFQQSALRLRAEGFTAPVVVTNSDFRFTVTQQLSQVGVDPGIGDYLIDAGTRDRSFAKLMDRYLSESISTSDSAQSGQKTMFDEQQD